MAKDDTIISPIRFIWIKPSIYAVYYLPGTHNGAIITLLIICHNSLYICLIDDYMLLQLLQSSDLTIVYWLFREYTWSKIIKGFKKNDSKTFIL